MKCHTCEVNYDKIHNYVVEVHDGAYWYGRDPDRVYEYYSRDTAQARVQAELARTIEADVISESILERKRELGKITTTYVIAASGSAGRS